jgi:methanethiol S-methyltransferase
MKFIALALIWSAYCFQHSFLISNGFIGVVKSRYKKFFPFYRLVYVIISFALLVPVLYYSHLWRSEIIITWSPFLNYIRYALIAISLFIAGKSLLIDYDPLAFIGFRQIMNYHSHKESLQTGIKKTGLLGIVRHPLYFASIVLLWCNTFRLSDIVVNSVLTLYFIIGTLLEERKLVLEFGDSYVQYKKEVPMLIPFIGLKKKFEKEV